MFRMCTLVAVFLILAFIAFCDGISYFTKLYNTVLHPKAWKKVEIVDEKSTFEEMTAIADSLTWSVVERVMWAIVGFLICFYIGWNMDYQVKVLVRKGIKDVCLDLENKFDALEVNYVSMKTTLEDVGKRIDKIESELDNDTVLITDLSANHKSSQTIQVEKYQTEVDDKTHEEKSQESEYPNTEDANTQNATDVSIIDSPPKVIYSPPMVVCHDELSYSANHLAEKALPCIKEEQTYYRESSNKRDTVVWKNDIYPVEKDLEPISCYSERRGSNSEYVVNTSIPSHTCDEAVNVEDNTPVALGSGECEEAPTCVVNQQRRIPHYRNLRKGCELRAIDENMSVKVSTSDVTPHRATTPRMYKETTPEYLETPTTNNGSRRKKQRSYVK